MSERNFISSLLARTELFTDAQITEIVSVSRESSESITSVIVSNDFVEEKDFLEAFSKVLNIPFARLADVDIEPEVLDLIPTKAVFQYNIIPLSVEEDGTIHIATNDPVDLSVNNAVRLVTNSARICWVLSPSLDISSTIKRFYGLGAETVDKLMNDDRFDMLDGEDNFAVPSANTAPMVIGAIDKAVDYVALGQARSMVTAPIHKAALYDAGFTCPGHTEYLAELSTKHFHDEFFPVMMLASEQLCVVPLTIHVALSEVPKLINHALLVRTIGTIHDAMKKYFGVPSPTIAVSGLNPHAGENNAMGFEDSRIIAPAIDLLKKKGINVTGPHPADTMFHASARSKYDVALCMYHDQALIPIKTIDFDAGVNVNVPTTATADLFKMSKL
jgi:4-hydroxy-L-threonine phosphate dehydrogenase PdxA